MPASGNNIRCALIYVIAKRKYGSLRKLEDNIRELGLLNPIILVKGRKRYLLVDGARRLKVYRKWKRKTIPAIVIGD